MIKLFLPTFNRSSKLARVLKTYALWKQPPQIFVFDGSDDPLHALENSRSATLYDFVRYSHNIVSLTERCSLFIEACDNDDIFFMANDEDVYLESFCDLSFQMMSDSMSFSAVVGSYLTFWPPMISSMVPRFSIKKLIPCSFTLTGTLLQKISMHIALNQSSKLPPLTYSPQRLSNFKEFVHHLSNAKIRASAWELLLQFHLMSKGDIAFIPSTMLLRDETRINYQIEADRQGDSAYIEPQEVEKVFDIIFGRSSDLSTYLNCIYSPPISGFVARFRDSFVSSYLTPITPMVFSHRVLFRSFYRFSQAIYIRTVSVINAFVFLISPMLSRSVRYYVIGLFLCLCLSTRSKSL